MRPIHFRDVNITLTGEGVEDLPAHKGDGFFVSRWKPSLFERLSILVFGNVWFGLLGEKHPPIAITGGRVAHFTLPRSDLGSRAWERWRGSKG